MIPITRFTIIQEKQTLENENITFENNFKLVIFQYLTIVKVHELNWNAWIEKRTVSQITFVTESIISMLHACMNLTDMD